MKCSLNNSIYIYEEYIAAFTASVYQGIQVLE